MSNYLPELDKDSLEKMRVVSFARAGASFVLILSIMQISTENCVFASPLYFACCGMSLLAATAFMVENYIYNFGKISAKPLPLIVMILTFFMGGVCLVISLALVLDHYRSGLAWFFVTISILSFILVMWHGRHTKPTS